MKSLCQAVQFSIKSTLDWLIGKQKVFFYSSRGWEDQSQGAGSSIAWWETPCWWRFLRCPHMWKGIWAPQRLFVSLQGGRSHPQGRSIWSCCLGFPSLTTTVLAMRLQHMSFKGHTHADHSNSLGKKVIKKKLLVTAMCPQNLNTLPIPPKLCHVVKVLYLVQKRCG